MDTARGGGATESILYVDILFCIDFSMDFLSLLAAGRIFSHRLVWYRLAAGAMLGALYGVLSVLFSPGAVPAAFLSAAVSAAMTLCAYGGCGRIGFFVRTVVTVWGCGALLAGVMTLLSGFFGSLHLSGGIGDLLAAAALPFLCSFRVRRRASARTVRVRFAILDQQYEGTALVDSGNLLTEPISGLPVILVSRRNCLFPEWDAEHPARGFRAVPLHRGGKTVILAGVICPAVEITDGKHTLRRRAVICEDPDTERADGYGGCAVLIPAALL